MTTANRKSGAGCFFYGCLTSILLLVLGAVVLYFGGRWWIGQQVERFTDNRPMALPVVEFTPEEAAAVRERVESFTKALETGEPTTPLSLTERDLNLLIATVPDFEKLRDKVHIGIEGDRIRGTLSLPLEALGLPGLQRFRGRYLNGSAGLRASMENGILLVVLESLMVKGQPVPETILTALQQQNLAKDLYESPEDVRRLQRLDSITIADGRLTIRPRVATAF